MKEIKTICVVGGGSAGSLSALTLKRLLPGRRVITVSAPNIPVIGVGESTTAYLPVFLHQQLALDRARFHKEVKPGWKLGIRFVWGPPEISHFNYPFSFELSERTGNLRKRAAYYYRELGGSAGIFSLLMDHDKSPIVKAKGRYHSIDLPYGYHIDNPRFLKYLKQMASEAGVESIEGTILNAQKDTAGNVATLMLDGDRRIEADLFVDCSGFQSLLLNKEMGVPFVSYSPPLRCDAAIVGDIPRTGTIRPYTSAETMDHGWCWKIELPDRVSVGYVHASDFCSLDQARDELKRKNPDLTDDLRTVRFPSGRYQNFWHKNVVGIGNASGFVEPLESTALHVICEQLVMVCATLLDSDYRIEPAAVADANTRFRKSWDAIRDFLAVHYKFNTRSNSAFWQVCRAETELGQAEEIVRLYHELGPHVAMKHAIVTDTLVQFEGYLALLMGQQVPTNSHSQFDDQDKKDWQDLQDYYQSTDAMAISLREALGVVAQPGWKWS
ncbi:tryptophan halogenase family protein [Alisedimentitalea sp. MJ-SS2]|uniref:tryptophan halogenase family protein n=1 Tax=Aliisedimentitalea sp. MJ-SS2 TaxID=3049795 RepID=UPI0029123250|nr:tryptophan halogenase family protein [Alisedimentitalea sp. MJ-SS2]MDU8929957.1 tryptophan halogenase family protein [Alisedimentitalea sp. MJ-SS2]